MPVVKVWNGSQWVTATNSFGNPEDATYVTLSSNATLTSERVLTQGTGIIITDGTTTVTVAADATSTNTASKVVIRDASGNFAAGTITAAALAASGTVSAVAVPAGPGTVSTLGGTETLTNKTLTTPVITQSTSTPTFTTNVYTLVIGDAGGMLLASNSTTAGTVRIPTNASVAFATGTQIHIIQTGTGQLTITATTPATTTVLSNGATAASPKLRTQYSSATMLKTGTNTWYVFGDIV